MLITISDEYQFAQWRLQAFSRTPGNELQVGIRAVSAIVGALDGVLEVQRRCGSSDARGPSFALELPRPGIDGFQQRDPGGALAVVEDERPEPVTDLEVEFAGGCYRHISQSNWKLQIENLRQADDQPRAVASKVAALNGCRPVASS